MPKFTKAQKAAYAKRMNKKKRPIRKKPLMKARQQIVEVKKRDSYEIAQLNKNPDGTAGNHYPFYTTGLNEIVNNDALYIFELPAWYRNSHGFEGHNCVGDSITSKWLDFRVSMDFPLGSNVIVKPVRLYLVHGWIKLPVGSSDTTVPTKANMTQTEIRNHVYHQLTEYFDNKRDFLVPRDMSGSNIKILGYKRVAPNRDMGIGAQTTGFPSVPSINRKIKFTINRKIKLEQGTAELTNFPAATHDTQNLFVNNAWLPFVLLYNPDFENMKNSVGADVRMTVRYNSTHYFTDS